MSLIVTSCVVKVCCVILVVLGVVIIFLLQYAPLEMTGLDLPYGPIKS